MVLSSSGGPASRLVGDPCGGSGLHSGAVGAPHTAEAVVGVGVGREENVPTVDDAEIIAPWTHVDVVQWGVILTVHC